MRFHPHVGEGNIKTFYNLIQLDGYNPLVVKPTTYRLADGEGLDALVGGTGKQRLLAFFEKDFSPGSLLRLLETEDLELPVEKEVFLQEILAKSKEVQHAELLEGYWTDHFVYNLDQVEAYLSVYPEKRTWLLFEDVSYSYRVPEAKVLPRSRRYVQGKEGLRQYRSLEKMPRSKEGEELLRGSDGTVYVGSLAQKFLVLLGTKFASLDPSGRGIDMEAGKPGWYDALNGLPGIFGSSVADACELLRFMKFFYAVLQDETREIQVPAVLAALLHDIMEVLSKAERVQSSSLEVWKGLNRAKEDYRVKIYGAFDGEETAISAEEVRELLHACMDYLSQGITAAAEENQGICPTYYYYEVESFQGQEGAFEPLAFQRRTMPLFLEGAVKYLGLLEDAKEKRAFAGKVRESALYDPLLRMYKVNASLEKVSYDVGRAKAFTPGWLENESIWLHMSYKYLLALLKSGLHGEFHAALETSCIPFLKAEVYGRSLLENSSFIASSANPDARIHGKGFVARLSGSTAEFLEIWHRMMFGDAPFTMVEGHLALRFQPSLPKILVGEDRAVQAMFLGMVPVTYHLPKQMALIPGSYRVERIHVTDAAGHTATFAETITGPWPERIRAGQVEKIDITLAE